MTKRNQNGHGELSLAHLNGDHGSAGIFPLSNVSFLSRLGFQLDNLIVETEIFGSLRGNLSRIIPSELGDWDRAPPEARHSRCSARRGRRRRWRRLVRATVADGSVRASCSVDRIDRWVSRRPGMWSRLTKPSLKSRSPMISASGLTGELRRRSSSPPPSPERNSPCAKSPPPRTWRRLQLGNHLRIAAESWAGSESVYSRFVLRASPQLSR